MYALLVYPLHALHISFLRLYEIACRVRI